MNKNSISSEMFIEWLKREVKPALGCTEPTSIAFAAAAAVQYLKGEIREIRGEISKNLYKNADGVRLPGTTHCGVQFAAAIGAIGGKASLDLEVLRDITPAHIIRAKQLVDNQCVAINDVDSPCFIYVDMTVVSELNCCRVILQDSHTHITQIFVDGNEIPIDNTRIPLNHLEALPSFSIYDALDFINQIDYSKIAFMQQAINLNSALSDEGKSVAYGLNVSGTLQDAIDEGFSSANLLNQIVIDTTAASDARMGGAKASAMTNFGSGNQGITATMPVVTMARHLGASEEKQVRAVTFSHLVAISIHARYTRLSALCAASTAAMGAAAGMCWLLTNDYAVISNAIKNMIGDISGIICDGASNTCAMKVSSVTASAVKSVLLARKNLAANQHDGIVHADLEQTINALCQLATSAMCATDQQIIQIMSNKA